MEHLLDLNELANELNTKINLEKPETSYGLTSEFAAEKLLECGPNALTPPPETHWILKFLYQFTNFFMMLLMLAGFLCFIAYILDTT